MSLLTELSLITLHWFLTSFASVVHIKLLLRIWDLFFYEGSLVLFQLTLGMLSMKVIPISSSSFLVLRCLILSFRGNKVLYPLRICVLGMYWGRWLTSSLRTGIYKELSRPLHRIQGLPFPLSTSFVSICCPPLFHLDSNLRVHLTWIKILLDFPPSLCRHTKPSLWSSGKLLMALLNAPRD